jgi:hypothetical protein
MLELNKKGQNNKNYQQRYRKFPKPQITKFQDSRLKFSTYSIKIQSLDNKYNRGPNKLPYLN